MRFHENHSKRKSKNVSTDNVATDKELDQFYTNPEVAQYCKEILTETLNDISGYSKKGIQYIEPSAGTGAFFGLLPNRKLTGLERNKVASRLGFDLEPKYKGILKADFLQREIKDNEMVPYSQRVILGNPPFGKRSKLAIEFFNKATHWAPTVAFIIPLQFRKWSVQSKLNKKFSLVVDKDLPEDSFIFKGKPYDVRCCFQVWTRKKTNLADLRMKTKPDTTHPDFEMYQYNNTQQAAKYFSYNWDFAVLRQGYGDYKTLHKSQSSLDRSKQWIFFKASSKKALSRLKKMDFEALSLKNTTTPGFGKADVVNNYTELYGD